MIIRLHQNLINKIAAGEVVERPASVVKELIENSIDAQAKQIDLNIENGGSKLIEVADNGIGMDIEDAKIACMSHTTSKIASVEDLDNINSMGFRGEALASIASVSKFTLQTKSNNEEVGYLLFYKGGKKAKEEEISKNDGTSVRVEDLFYNTPARLKFLKTTNTEYKHILTVFINYALSYPKIHFTLNHNDKLIYNLPEVQKDSFNEELLSRSNDLFGSKLSDNMIPVTYRGPKLEISGIIGHPEMARSTRGKQILFINRRPINDRAISRAIYDAYTGLIPKNKYPVFILFLSLDPRNVDVNVHPRKSEVRFSEPSQIFQSAKTAARQTILKFLRKDTNRALSDYSDFFNHKRDIQDRLPRESLKQSSQLKAPKPTISQSLDFTRELLSNDSPQNTIRPKQTGRSFQVFNSYIIIEKKDSLLVIDQHAAAERVTYEKLQQEIRNSAVETQKLLIPETIDFDKSRFELLKEKRRELSKFGIDLVIFGKSAFKIDEVPLLIASANVEKLIRDIADYLDSDLDNRKVDSLRDLTEKIISTMACHTSIRAGMKLEREEIENLVKNLLECENPYSCPHGRKIIWEIERKDLEKKFGRH